MPTYILLLSSSVVKADTSDIIFSQLVLGAIFLAYTADQQQWGRSTLPPTSKTPPINNRSIDYQTAKKSYQSTAKLPAGTDFSAEDLDRGFLNKGLWSLSRHPNFLAEQSVWVFLYAWSCWVTKSYYNWSGLGAVAYLLLFQASTWFTELLTNRKYEDYKIYQKAVGKFVPSILGGGVGDLNGEKAKKEK